MANVHNQVVDKPRFVFLDYNQSFYNEHEVKRHDQAMNSMIEKKFHHEDHSMPLRWLHTMWSYADLLSINMNTN